MFFGWQHCDSEISLCCLDKYTLYFTGPGHLTWIYLYFPWKCANFIQIHVVKSRWREKHLKYLNQTRLSVFKSFGKKKMFCGGKCRPLTLLSASLSLPYLSPFGPLQFAQQPVLCPTVYSATLTTSTSTPRCVKAAALRLEM